MDNINDFEINSPRWLLLESFEGEIWKDVVGNESLYMVSNYGRVKTKSNIMNNYQSKILKLYFPNVRGCYWKVNLKINGFRRTRFVHRLVAEAFLPNPENLPEVNHKDENKKNPHLDNLEWCTRKYNANYGTLKERMRKHIYRRINEGSFKKCGYGIKHKEVHQYDLNANYIATFSSLKEAEHITGINRNNICDACKDRLKVAGGFIWSYTNKKEEIIRKINLAKESNGTKRNKTIILPIDKYTLNNKYICTYKNASIAAKEIGVHYTSIIKCAKGLRKQCSGYIWKFHF